ncbi:hypothetical protein CC80DRAFT_548987 [Byssothecium circinans]|uniref:Uncharacterized protein n=1 Tax=Byssothecium circinans TaxID=147558 RepID=A0A6A5TYY9_9PLEO|nr:hypothetical protein CC80DRAFT_548987 [Byssothecium circinans]
MNDVIAKEHTQETVGWLWDAFECCIQHEFLRIKMTLWRVGNYDLVALWIWRGFEGPASEQEMVYGDTDEYLDTLESELSKIQLSILPAVPTGSGVVEHVQAYIDGATHIFTTVIPHIEKELHERGIPAPRILADFIAWDWKASLRPRDRFEKVVSGNVDTLRSFRIGTRLNVERLKKLVQPGIAGAHLGLQECVERIDQWNFGAYERKMKAKGVKPEASRCCCCGEEVCRTVYVKEQ